jgi:hypothetical protein
MSPHEVCHGQTQLTHSPRFCHRKPHPTHKPRSQPHIQPGTAAAAAETGLLLPRKWGGGRGTWCGCKHLRLVGDGSRTAPETLHHSRQPPLIHDCQPHAQHQAPPNTDTPGAHDGWTLHCAAAVHFVPNLSPPHRNPPRHATPHKSCTCQCMGKESRQQHPQQVDISACTGPADCLPAIWGHGCTAKCCLGPPIVGADGRAVLCGCAALHVSPDHPVTPVA